MVLIYQRYRSSAANMSDGQIESKFQSSTSCNKQRTCVTLLEEFSVFLTKLQLPQVKAKKGISRQGIHCLIPEKKWNNIKKRPSK